MSNIEKIKAEIERLENMDYPCDTSEQATGFYNALDRISTFIDSLPEEDFPKIKGWIARNKDGSLVFCYHKPKRENSITQEWWGSCDADFRIYDDTIDEQFKDLKWEDEPREVELFIKPIDKPKEMSVNETMAYLEEKIAKASKSWEGVDVDKFLDEIRGREPDDLEEAANKYSENHGFRVPYDGSNNFYDEVDVKASKEGFIAGAKWELNQGVKATGMISPRGIIYDNNIGYRLFLERYHNGDKVEVQIRKLKKW